MFFVIASLFVDDKAVDLIERAGLEPARRGGIERSITVEAEPEELISVGLSQRATTKDAALTDLTMGTKKTLLFRHVASVRGWRRGRIG